MPARRAAWWMRVPSGPAMRYAIIAKNPRLKIPEQQQDREPGLALEPPGVEQGADPRHEAADRAAGDGHAADDAEPEEGPRERAPVDPDDVGAAHHEHVVRDREPDGRDAEDGARDDGDDAADEESGDGGLGHWSFPFEDVGGGSVGGCGWRDGQTVITTVPRAWPAAT